MIITKELEAAVTRFMDNYWDTYLSGDIETWSSFLTDDYKNIGGTEEEIWNNKTEIIDYTMAIIDQMVGVVELRNKRIQVFALDPFILAHEFTDMYIKIRNEWSFYGKFRLSSIIQQSEGSFKVIHQHGSYPDSKTGEGEAFAFEKISTENRELKDAIKRRTVELENKTRELEIEAALERVRAVAMGMRNADDILDICKGIFTELQLLGFSDLRNALINFWDDESKALIDYDYSDYAGGHKAKLLYKSHPVFDQFQEKIRQAKDSFAELVIDNEMLESWKQRRRDSGEYEDPRLGNINTLYYYFYSIGVGAVGISTFSSLTTEKLNILKRFRNVFDLAYRRYLDIEKAEAQAREAKIEAALERTRTQSMIMQHSNELDDTLRVFHEQVLLLGIKSAFSFLWLPDEKNDRHIFWAAWGEDQPCLPGMQAAGQAGTNAAIVFKSKAINYPLDRNEPATAQCLDDWKSNEPVYSYHVPPAAVVNYFAAWQELIDGVEQLKPRYFSGGLYYVEAFMKYGCFGVMVATDLREDEKKILARFAIEFERTYTRFLDLQKAEAQAREAQIEAALERVRSRTMAMQNSHELAELVSTVFKELTYLDFSLTSCILWIDHPELETDALWMASSEMSKPAQPYFIKPFHHPFFRSIIHAWKEKDPKWIYTLAGAEKQSFENAFFDEIPGLPEAFRKALAVPEKVVFSASFSNFGALEIVGTESLPDEKFDILHRFGKVFDSGYTRFNDLQKAEAQAREAQIETGLERVRSRSMAMHHTSELQEVIHTVHKELLNLNIAINGGSFIAINKDIETTLRCWGSGGTANTSNEVQLPLYEKPFCTNLINKIKNGPGFFTEEYTQQEKIDFFTFLFEYDPWSKLDAKQKKEILSSPGGYTRSCCVSQHTTIFIINHYGEIFSEGDNDILQRFSKVFEQAYTRFFDLQKAEAQAREAQIETALEKVRSRSMGMQKSEELQEVIKIVYQQLKHLNINLDHAGFVVDYTPKGDWHFWIADEQDIPSKISHPYFESVWANQFTTAKEKGEDFFATYLNFEEKNKFYNELLSYIPGLPKTSIDFYLRCPGLAATTVLLENVGLYIENFSGTPYTDEENNTLMRFGKVFQQSYTRFLDLQKAEAQAREAQIEASLERVRSRTMGMQHSNELTEVSSLLFRQVQSLGVPMWGCGFNIWEKDDKFCMAWLSSEGLLLPPVRIPLNEDPTFIRLYEYRQKGELFYTEEVGGDELADHFRYLLGIPGFREIHANYLEAGFKAPTIQINNVVYFSHGNLIFISPEPVPEAEDIFRRFAKVFEQTYTRFLDLQKAEAQAREAKIEAALEKVRSRSLAMHKSEELQEVVNTVFEKLNDLEVDLYTAIIFIFTEGSKDMVWWLANKVNQQYSKILVPYSDNIYLENIFDAKEKGKDFFSATYSFEEKNEFFHHLFENTDFKYAPEHQKKFLFESKLATMSVALAKNTGINITSYSRASFSEKENEILKRFAKVFEQAYTRFLDLQKAEEQAREARIEAALEKVRSRTMAMQKSEELGDVATVLFKELNLLVENLWTCGFVLCERNRAEDEWWLSTETGFIPAFYLPNTGDVTHANIYAGWKNGETYHTEQLEDAALKEHYAWLMNIPASRKIFEEMLATGFSLPTWQKLHCAYFSQGYLVIITQVPCTEETIFKRFAQVFDQTYTRFLDLQKAEAQTREAQIEAALEKVRSRSLAMHKSEEIKDVVVTVMSRMNELSIEMNGGVSLATFVPDSDGLIHWYINPGQVDDPVAMQLPYFDNIILNDFVAARKAGKELLPVVYTEVEKNTYFKYAFEHSDFKIIPDELKQWIFAQPYFGYSVAIQKHAAIFFNDYTGKLFSEKENDVLLRFAKVFEQSYIRFLDLQKAEAQAKESQIEAALERVRSRTLAMQKSGELSETATVLFQQLILLGIEPNRLYITIIKDEEANAEFWITDEDGGKVSTAFETNMTNNTTLEKMYTGWKEKNKTLVIDMRGNELQDYLNYLNSIHLSLKGGPTQTRRLQYIAYFNRGFIGMASPDEQPEETVQLLARFAAVFNLTFTRFNDLKIAEAHAIQAGEDLVKLQTEKQRAEEALAELQVTQKQLIQSEKMASLGELTAGIAHEIQNPLNFVNNFSEVSNELIDEMMEEVAKGHYEEAKAIADDVKQNLSKINLHGKRADGIVKGMLQHSRSSTGQKEPTDINALADEYLRLAYHGMRAKDKSFNVTLKTDYDDSIGNINIIPQDIGRVILNLITNAFYAVTEKKEKTPSIYEPTVTVSTKLLRSPSGTSRPDSDRDRDLGVCVSVIDNGNGIPQKVLDKIFQPFFTTKPTGQGTGLGLSLSYDIVKAHGGELKVETKEGEGSKFIIYLK
jgi:signal transduction histidine kinase